MKLCRLTIWMLFICLSLPRVALAAGDYEVGAFYFPGWNSGSRFWKDLKGEPASRSPGVAWPERRPLLGYYPEEEPWVAEKHIEWATSHGIGFFAYDWYWYGDAPDTEHAQKTFLKARNNGRMKFCLHWANHNTGATTLAQFDKMVSHWIRNYFGQPSYYTVDGKPVVFIFSAEWLARQAMTLRLTPLALLQRAASGAKVAGFAGIYFIGITNERPGEPVEKRLASYGFDAYTGWNYVRSRLGDRVADYEAMVATYLEFYEAAAAAGQILPYIAAASPGFDDRPWYGDEATVRTDPTPAKFSRMLKGAKALLDKPRKGPRMVMIESWNEFAEGSYIEPTVKFGFDYLEAIRDVFAPAPAERTSP